VQKTLPAEPTEAPSVGRRIGRVAAFCLGWFVLLSIVAVTLYRDAPVPFTPLMLLRRVEDGYGIDKSWRPLGEISPFLIRTVVAGEDEKFCLHHGFNGSSTISMQTAKNVFLWPGRNWLRKGLEAYFTGLIELAWSKRRIIEVYLNVVEWGPGIYGAEAASEHYFHKSANRLSPEEAVRLAAALPDPLDRSPRGVSSDAAARGAFIWQHAGEIPVWQPLPCGEELQ
jgi:monofunctional glycosyltransferase